MPLFKKVDGGRCPYPVRYGNQKKEAQVEQMSQSEARIWFTGRHAVYLKKREGLIAAQTALEAKLEEAKAEVVKSAWKWKKTVGDPQPIRKVKAEMAAAAAALEAFDIDPANMRLLATMEEYWAWDRDEAEMEVWRTGGPAPAFYRRKKAQELAQFFTECEVLPIIKTF